jgi:TonB-linked SusC/RagA family outer membrane protein
LAQKTISGKVISNADSQPVAGATVSIRGTQAATQTATDGTFSIRSSQSDPVLVISSVGFSNVEVSANGRSVLGNISLTPAASALNEVVVTGYSSQRRKDITGSVSVVKAADLQAVPATTAENQLQGRAPGVVVTSNNQPGSVSTVRIHGFSSFTGNDPLYIVDGVPVSSLLGINPDDIESMQILKDASSASIYGARASNGVIVVTTRKGRQGTAKVTYNMYYGIQDPGKGWTNMLNPREYADLQWLALKNSGQTQQSVQYGTGATPVLPDYILAGSASGVKEGDPAANPALYDLNYTNLGDANYSPYLIVKANKEGTNWWKALTRKAPITNHNVTVSGGASDKSRYLFSLNYFNQDGIVINNFYKRYTARINTEFNIKKNIRIGENLQVYFAQGNAAANNTEASELQLSRLILPIIPIYTINGDFAGTKGNGLGTSDNPIAVRERVKNNRANNSNLLGNAYVEVDFLRHFTARSNFGGLYTTSDYKNYPTIEYEGAENNRNPTFAEGFSKFRSWTWTNQLTYKNTFGDHNLQALAGSESVEESGDQIVGSRSNYFSYFNVNYITLSSGTSNQLVSGVPTTPSALFSLFAKVDYSFKDKYLVSGTIRRDGSSRFGSENRYGVFPAGSLGWRVSEEPFMQNIRWISDLKIRGSYGTMGNQRINAANQFTQFATSNGSASYDIFGTSNIPTSGFYLSFVGNTGGKWETNVSSNIGFDATLFNNQTNIVFDFYQKKTKDLLYTVEQIATAGGTASGNPPFFNVGSMKNWGIDMAVSQRANLGNAIKLDATLTFTTYKNEITGITDGITFFDYNSPLNEQNRIGGVFTRNAVGHAVNSYYGYQVTGLFQNTEDVSKSPTQKDAAPGRFKYLDANRDGTIDANDRVFFGNPNPDFTYGLNINLSYKRFDITAFLYGVQGKDAINYSRFQTDFYATGITNKSEDALYNSWSPSNPNAKVPIQENTSTFSTNGVPNSFYKENASYLRLRNLSLGYNLPASLLSRFKIDQFRIYAQAVNLFTITKYTGLDPEIITTDDRAAGIDSGVYPTVRQYLVGLSINF